VNESNPEDLPEGLNEDDYEALKEAEKVENGNKMTMEPAKTDGNHEAYITQPNINMHPEANNMINAPMMPAMDPNF
jgi:flagellar basal body rod protein FlgC